MTSMTTSSSQKVKPLTSSSLPSPKPSTNKRKLPFVASVTTPEQPLKKLKVTSQPNNTLTTTTTTSTDNSASTSTNNKTLPITEPASELKAFTSCERIAKLELIKTLKNSIQDKTSAELKAETQKVIASIEADVRRSDRVLRQTLDSVTAQYKEECEKTQQLNKQHDEDKQEIEKLKGEVKSVEKKNTDLLELMEGFTSDGRKATSTQTELKNEIVSLKNTLSKNIKDLRKIKLQNDKLSKNLKTVQSESTQYSESLKISQQAEQALQAQVTKVNRDYEILKQQQDIHYSIIHTKVAAEGAALTSIADKILALASQIKNQ